MIEETKLYVRCMQHRRYTTEQQEPQQKPGVNPGALEGCALPAPLVTFTAVDMLH
jgi:hypothetical protein